jgi:hypothetical protein
MFPKNVEIAPCDQQGNVRPYGGEDIQADNGRRWFSTRCDLPGGRTAVQGFSKLTVPDEGEILVVAKVRYDGSPGWISSQETVHAVRGRP